MFLYLNKDFGEKMALTKVNEQEAILVLSNRIETEGPFFILLDDTHHYPIIRFERPPELCGIDEEKYLDSLDEFKKKFLDSLIEICKKENIEVLYCAGINNPKAKPYKNVLSQADIRLRDVKELSSKKLLETGSKIIY